MSIDACLRNLQIVLILLAYISGSRASGVSCEPYSAKMTNSARSAITSSICHISAAGDQTISISSICHASSKCSGEGYFRLLDASTGMVVAEKNVGTFKAADNANSLARLVVPGNRNILKPYVLMEGCTGSSSCTGHFHVEGAEPYLIPEANNNIPKEATAICPQYSNSYPETTSCYVSICGGSEDIISLSSENCQGDTHLTLYDANGRKVAENDDFVDQGLCSNIVFKPPKTLAQSCEIYRLEQGCAFGSMESCGGVVQISKGFVLSSPQITKSPVSTSSIV